MENIVNNLEIVGTMENMKQLWKIEKWKNGKFWKHGKLKNGKTLRFPGTENL